MNNLGMDEFEDVESSAPVPAPAGKSASNTMDEFEDVGSAAQPQGNEPQGNQQPQRSRIGDVASGAINAARGALMWPIDLYNDLDEMRKKFEPDTGPTVTSMFSDLIKMLPKSINKIQETMQIKPTTGAESGWDEFAYDLGNFLSPIGPGKLAVKGTKALLGAGARAVSQVGSGQLGKQLTKAMGGGPITQELVKGALQIVAGIPGGRSAVKSLESQLYSTNQQRLELGNQFFKDIDRPKLTTEAEQMLTAFLDTPLKEGQTLANLSGKQLKQIQNNIKETAASMKKAGVDTKTIDEIAGFVKEAQRGKGGKAAEVFQKTMAIPLRQMKSSLNKARDTIKRGLVEGFPEKQELLASIDEILGKIKSGDVSPAAINQINKDINSKYLYNYMMPQNVKDAIKPVEQAGSRFIEHYAHKFDPELLKPYLVSKELHAALSSTYALGQLARKVGLGPLLKQKWLQMALFNPVADAGIGTLAVKAIAGTSMTSAAVTATAAAAGYRFYRLMNYSKTARQVYKKMLTDSAKNVTKNLAHDAMVLSREAEKFDKHEPETGAEATQ